MTCLRPVALMLVVTGLARPVAAQQPPLRIPEGALLAAAESSGTGLAQSRQKRRRIPKAFLWTGVGLAGYGGFLLLLGAGYGPDARDCPGGNCTLCGPTVECPSIQRTLFKGATIPLASGAAVLLTGALVGAARSPARTPHLSVDRHGLAVHQTIRFGRYPGRTPRRDERSSRIP